MTANKRNEEKKKIQLGDIVRLETVKPVQGGAVLAWYGGHTIFVDGGLPCEEVSVEITQVRSKYLRAKPLQVHSRNPERREPSCAAAAQGAGCCDYAHASTNLQHAMKLAVVHDQLSRLAHLEEDIWPTSVHSLGDSLSGWRIRQRYTADSQGRLGTYQKWSHNLIVREDYPCSQEDSRLHELFWKESFPPGSEVVLAVGDEGDLHAVLLEYPSVAQKKDCRRSQSVTRRQLRQRAPKRTILIGSGVAHQNVQGTSWKIPVECFWQAHRNAAETYAAVVSSEADLAVDDVAWDLYGGAGIFAKALSTAQSDCGDIWSIDVDSRSISAGAEACAEVPQIRLAESSVGHWLSRNENTLPPPGTVVVDPPRSGVGRSAIEKVSARNPHTILHFGCDPASFARDLADWKCCGYGVQKIKVFDAFPNTHHMECFAKLEPLL